jgi:SET domain-containing protein
MENISFCARCTFALMFIFVNMVLITDFLPEFQLIKRSENYEWSTRHYMVDGEHLKLGTFEQELDIRVGGYHTQEIGKGFFMRYEKKIIKQGGR